MRNVWVWLLPAWLTLPCAVHAVEWHTPEAAKHLIGKETIICGRVGSTRFAENSRGFPTYINLGPAFPNHVFTIVIWGRDRASFPKPPENLSGVICVSGEIADFSGTPQIIVRSPKQISSSE